MLRRALRSESIRSDGIIESGASAGVTITTTGTGVVKVNALSRGGGGGGEGAGSTVVAAVNRNDEEVSYCYS
jgi:hypothetical protein